MNPRRTVRFRTCAKVNLFLRVLGRRVDGFHEVETILHGVGLCDDIEMSLSESPEVTIDMQMSDGVVGELPPDEHNLIVRAAKALTRSGPARGAHVNLKKSIPIAAGLGGGSGNAAGALQILAEMWELDLDKGALLELAGEMGSDVPYCLEGGTALATSKGDTLTPLPAPQPMWFLLAGSKEPLLTSSVYARWDDLPPVEEVPSAPMTLALGAGDVREVASLLHNDLEAASFSLRPDLEPKKEVLRAAGALGAAMSGSGPTMYAVASDEAHARSMAAKVEDDFDWLRVVPSQRACIERQE